MKRLSFILSLFLLALIGCSNIAETINENGDEGQSEYDYRLGVLSPDLHENVTLPFTLRGYAGLDIESVLIMVDGYPEIVDADASWQLECSEDNTDTGMVIFEIYGRNSDLDRVTNVTYVVIAHAPVAGDTTPPAITIDTPTDSQTIESSNVMVSGTAVDDTNTVDEVYVRIDSASFQLANGSESWNISLTPGTDGPHTAYAYAVDSAGNHSATNSVSFSVDTSRLQPDTTPPTLSISSPTAGATIYDSNFIVSGNASDTDSGLNYVMLSLDGSGYETANGTGSWTKAYSNINFDSHSVYAYAVDNNGNHSITNSVSFTTASNQGGTYTGNYYDGIDTGLTGTAFKQELHNLINSHTTLSYSAVWNVYDESDMHPDGGGKIWDMYSDNPDGPEPYEYYYSSDQCGNYSGEGSCYNREHSWPKSWFGDASPMYTDVHHLVPTDGYVNGQRGNLPFGEVGSAEWTSQNGSKKGDCDYPGFSGDVFEPIDEYKGDFARIYFYMVTCYYGNPNFGNVDMADGTDLKPWAENMLREWHANDSVSEKEIIRNDAIHDAQGNRNPFVDHPEWVSKISDF